jgi:hypothetical protein
LLRAERCYALTGFRAFRSRWVGAIATRIPGGHHAHAGRPGQLAVPETNIGLAAKDDSGWRIEDGKAGYCARARGIARNVGFFARTLSL